MERQVLESEDDWEVVQSFLPGGWERKARESGAFRRARAFKDAGTLLRTLLIHLADGCSLRETTVRAHQGGLVSVSDVALLKRLKASGEWLRWMAEGVMRTWIERHPGAVFGDRRVRVVDGSTIQEPGATGSSWRIHYSIRLPSLECDEVQVTSPGVGETFQRFAVRRGDILLGDRGYAHRRGIAYVLRRGGEVLVRLNLTNVPLVDKKGAPYPLLRRLRKLRGTSLGDLEVWMPCDGGLIPGRVCALKKSKAAAEKARRKVLRENGRKGRRVRKETLEAASYVFVFTTLERREFGPARVLEMYRGRWQVELAFKRLKSIIGLGHLKKTDLDGAKAWIHGKLLVAFLVEALIAAGESFFPWGYPIHRQLRAEQVFVEGDVPDAPSS